MKVRVTYDGGALLLLDNGSELKVKIEGKTCKLEGEFGDFATTSFAYVDVPKAPHSPCKKCSPEPAGDCWRVDCPRFENQRRKNRDQR